MLGAIDTVQLDGTSGNRATNMHGAVQVLGGLGSKGTPVQSIL